MGLLFEILFDQLKKIILWLMATKMLINWICAVITIIYLPKILLNILADKLDRRGKPPIGKHFKEHPMDTVTVKFCASELEKHKDKKAGRKKEEYVPRMFVLGYDCKKEVIKNKNEATASRKANERLLLNFEKEAAAMLCGDNLCLFDRYGYVNEYKGEGEITDLSKHWDRSFCLGRDSKLALWLEGQEKIRDYVACLYPEGNIGDAYNVFFQHEEIAKIYHLGMESEDENKLQQMLDKV